jgi:hypothetical protein
MISIDSGADDVTRIAQVLALYCHSIDSNDEARFLSIFADDASWESEGVGRFVGTEQLRNFLRNAPKGFRHFTSNLIVEISGDHAAASSYAVIFDTSQQPPAVRAAGVYQDELVRAGGGWKIRAQRFSR